MIPNSKLKIIFLISLGFIFALSIIAETSPISNIDYSNSNPEHSSHDLNLNVLEISGKIHIDNNWSDAKAVGACIGLGTESDPYIIKNLRIDAGGSGSCILIENCDVYFKIENCYLNNTGHDYYDAGIRLINVENGQIINNIGGGEAFGICLNGSDNNIILNNTFTNKRGLYMGICYDNVIYLNNFIATQVNTFILLNVENANSWSSLKKARYVYKGKTFTNYLGNYYALYKNIDENNDGIGDTPYIKYGNPDLYVDYHPLIDPTENYEHIKFLQASENKIPGFNLFFLLGALSIGFVLIFKNKIGNKN